MTTTILATGAAGYIGSIAVEYLLKENYKVIVIDDLSTGHKESLPSDVEFFNVKVGDIDSLEKIFLKNKIDVVLHFAGAALVEESMHNPIKYFDINFCQAKNMLDVMIRFNVKKIVFSSTCAVYGLPVEIPIKEDTLTKPINPYGESKLLFEQVLQWYEKNYNLDFIALRYFNVAGATEKHGENHNPETHLIPLVLKAGIKSDFELSVYGNDYPTKDGTAIRDYIHVIDLIYAHINAIKVLIDRKDHKNIYNVGYGHGYSVMEIVNAAKEVLGKEIKYKIAPRRTGDPPVLIADSKNIRKDLYWKPQHDNIYEIIKSALKFTK